MKRRNLQTSKYVAAFAITVLIFVLGVIAGNAISEGKLVAITDLQNDIQIKTAGTELQYLLLSEHPCESVNATSLTEQLFEIGSKLDFMESSLGKDNKDVLSMKEYYSLLEIKHWLLTKKANVECKQDNHWILYFYSNLGDCNDCEQQGVVLSTLHKKYGKINIYSFDYNIDNPAIDAVKEIYQVKNVPTIVINNKAFPGFKDKEGVEEELFGNVTSADNSSAS